MNRATTLHEQWIFCHTKCYWIIIERIRVNQDYRDIALFKSAQCESTRTSISKDQYFFLLTSRRTPLTDSPTNLSHKGEKDKTDALWARSAKNTHVCTGPLARPFARSLAPLTRSLALDCSLRSRPPLRSLVRSLTHFAHSLARGKVNF